MYSVNATIQFKGWKAFDSNKVLLRPIYMAFMDTAAKQLDQYWGKHTPEGWLDKPRAGRMVDYIHKGDVEIHSWGYSVDVGILPVEDALEYHGDPEYPRYVDEGTGIHNLTRRSSGGKTFIRSGLKKGNFASRSSALITPVTHEVMKFEVPPEFDIETGEVLDAGVVYTKWTRGQRGQHFSDKVEKDFNNWMRIEKRKLKILIEGWISEGKLEAISAGVAAKTGFGL